MPRINFSRLSQNLQQLSDERLRRAVWGVAIALVAAVLLFAGFYTWDRYLAPDDKSPLELQVEGLEEAVRQDPQNPDLRVSLAESYLRAGEPERALEQSTQVLKADPEHTGALWVTGVALVRLGRPQEAIEPLEAFVEIRKENPMAHVDTALEAAYYYLGTSYLQLDRPADAVAALQAALKIVRYDADAIYQLALAYQAQGEHEKALEQLHNAVRFVPDFSEAYSAMIVSYQALGDEGGQAYARGMQAFSTRDFQTAKAELEQATQQLPEFSPAFLGLGLTYEQLGDLAAAEQAVRRALELDPNNLAAQQALGRIQASMTGQG